MHIYGVTACGNVTSMYPPEQMQELKCDRVKENISSAGEEKTSFESEKKSAPVPEENIPLLLNKTLATPAVRRMAVENKVRLCLLYFYMEGKNCTLSFSSKSLYKRH